jgi:hypothetical protein
MRSWNICRRWAVVGTLNTSSSSPFLAWKVTGKNFISMPKTWQIVKPQMCYLVDRAVAITSPFGTHVRQVAVGVVFLLLDRGRRAGAQRRRASDGHGSRAALILCRPFVESRRRFGGHERLTNSMVKCW